MTVPEHKRMKRNKPLSRKQTIKRSAALKRTAFVRRVTKRERAHRARMDELRPAVLAYNSWRCAICRSDRAVQVHHRLRRSQGGPDTFENLVALCDHHHRIVHANPEWSFDVGLLIHASDGPPSEEWTP